MIQTFDIVYYPDPILRRPTRPVGEITGEVRELVPSMIESMHHARGIGLAANQIGVDLRLAIVSDTGEPGDERVVIDPEVLSKEGALAMDEGCLSFPGITGAITRAERIQVRYRNLDGKTVTEEAEGLLARCFLHEVDHLDGIMFISKMTPADRMKAKRALKDLEERYTPRE